MFHQRRSRYFFKRVIFCIVLVLGSLNGFSIDKNWQKIAQKTARIIHTLQRENNHSVNKKFALYIDGLALLNDEGDLSITANTYYYTRGTNNEQGPATHTTADIESQLSTFNAARSDNTCLYSLVFYNLPLVLEGNIPLPEETSYAQAMKLIRETKREEIGTAKENFKNLIDAMVTELNELGLDNIVLNSLARIQFTSQESANAEVRNRKMYIQLANVYAQGPKFTSANAAYVRTVNLTDIETQTHFNDKCYTLNARVIENLKCILDQDCPAIPEPGNAFYQAWKHKEEAPAPTVRLMAEQINAQGQSVFADFQDYYAEPQETWSVEQFNNYLQTFIRFSRAMEHFLEEFTSYSDIHEFAFYLRHLPVNKYQLLPLTHRSWALRWLSKANLGDANYTVFDLYGGTVTYGENVVNRLLLTTPDNQLPGLFTELEKITDGKALIVALDESISDATMNVGENNYTAFMLTISKLYNRALLTNEEFLAQHLSIPADKLKFDQRVVDYEDNAPAQLGAVEYDGFVLNNNGNISVTRKRCVLTDEFGPAWTAYLTENSDIGEFFYEWPTETYALKPFEAVLFTYHGKHGMIQRAGFDEGTQGIVPAFFLRYITEKQNTETAKLVAAYVADGLAVVSGVGTFLRAGTWAYRAWGAFEIANGFGNMAINTWGDELPESMRALVDYSNWLMLAVGGKQILKGAYTNFSEAYEGVKWAGEGGSNIAKVTKAQINEFRALVEPQLTALKTTYANSKTGKAIVKFYEYLKGSAKKTGAWDNVVAAADNTLLNAFKDGYTSEQIIAIPKGQRPNPSVYLQQNYIDNHLAQFENGVTKITSYDPTGVVGPPGGTFVIPKSKADALIQLADGDVSKLEDLLGLNRGDLGTNPYRIDVSSPSGLRMPNGNEPGANEFWIPGGKTSGGILEATVDQIQLGTYSKQTVF